MKTKNKLFYLVLNFGHYFSFDHTHNIALSQNKLRPELALILFLFCVCSCQYPKYVLVLISLDWSIVSKNSVDIHFFEQKYSTPENASALLLSLVRQKRNVRYTNFFKYNIFDPFSHHIDGYHFIFEVTRTYKWYFAEVY